MMDISSTLSPDLTSSSSGFCPLETPTFFSAESLECLFNAGDHVGKTTKSHVYRVSKVAEPVGFEVPSCNGYVQTTEALLSYLGRNEENGNVFHVLVFSPSRRPSEAQSLLASEFISRYNIIDGPELLTDSAKKLDFLLNCDNGTAVLCEISVCAIRSQGSGRLETSSGNLELFFPGSVIVRYSPSDFNVVCPVEFSKTHRIHPEPRNITLACLSNNILYEADYNGVDSAVEIDVDLSHKLSAQLQCWPDCISIRAGNFPLASVMCPLQWSMGDFLQVFHFLTFTVNDREPACDSGRSRIQFGEIACTNRRNRTSPFELPGPLVSWAPDFLIDSPHEDSDFPDFICATRYYLGHEACSTPGEILTSAEEFGVPGMRCARCRQPVKRGKFLH